MLLFEWFFGYDQNKTEQGAPSAEIEEEKDYLILIVLTKNL